MGSEGRRSTSSSSQGARDRERNLVLVGANHRTAPIDTRETLVKRATYARLRMAGGSRPPWDDLVLLTTCNRIEVYATTSSAEETIRAICSALDMRQDAKALYVLSGTEAAAHLLRVASGLDSLAQGEGQITTQVRRAPSLRPKAWRTTESLTPLFERTAHAAPRIRALADLDESSASASHAAIRFLDSIVPLDHPTVAFLGTGKMARIAAGALRGRADILVANRDSRRAREVAHSLGGTGLGLGDLDRILERADVVLAATASKKPLVTVPRLRRILALRAGRPLWFVDLGFPRNIARGCVDLPGVTLVDIDGLTPWGARPLPPAAMARAEARIREEAERSLTLLRPSPAADIATLRRAVEDLRRREVAQALSRLPALSDADRAVVDKLATRLVNRVLHGPTERLRSFPEETRAEILQEILRGVGGGAR